MPIYNFKCSECHEETEKRLNVSERDSEFFCLKCKQKLERQPSQTGKPIFKGKDWTPKYHSND